MMAVATSPTYARPVTGVADLATEITRRLPDIKRGSLAVYGAVFGGRVDNIHVVTAARASDDLIVDFDEGETLEVWDPEDLTVNEREFRIIRCSRSTAATFKLSSAAIAAASGAPNVRPSRFGRPRDVAISHSYALRLP
jgi:hypothetical protein